MCSARVGELAWSQQCPVDFDFHFDFPGQQTMESSSLNADVFEFNSHCKMGQDGPQVTERADQGPLGASGPSSIQGGNWACWELEWRDQRDLV